MLRKLLTHLPKPARHRLMRRVFRFDPDACEQIEVRYARTGAEYRRAFEIVFEAYEAVGFFAGGNNPRARAARVLYYGQAALPTSNTIIALDTGVVVGTATPIRDSSMGLAADSLLGAEKSRLLAGGERAYEMSMLAVALSHRKGGRVLFGLLRYAAMISLHYDQADLSILTTHREMGDVLEGLMLFDPVGKPFIHPKARAPARGFCLDIRTIERRARAMYAGKPRNRNLATFFFDDGRARVRLPEPEWPTTLLPKLPPEEFRIAFGSPEELHEGLDERQLLVLRNAFSRRMRDALAEWLPAGSAPDRPTRYDSFLPVEVSIGGTKRKMTIVQLSAGGALLRGDLPLASDEEAALRVDFGRGRVAEMQGRVVRVDPAGRVALQLTATDAVWAEYLAFLEEWLWGSFSAPSARSGRSGSAAGIGTSAHPSRIPTS